MAIKRETKMNEETRLALVENNQAHIDRALERIENSLISLRDNMNSQFVTVDKHIVTNVTDLKTDINYINEKVEKLRDTSWSQFRWILASVGAPLYGAILTSVAHQLLTYFKLI